jgi:stalled ribosome alternative rescue factor ArfA
MDKKGLYANIHAKRKRIKAGSGERMRKPGSKGAPTEQDFKDAAKTVKEVLTVSSLAEKYKTSLTAIEVEIAKGLLIEKKNGLIESFAMNRVLKKLYESLTYYHNPEINVREVKSREELQEKKKKKTNRVLARDYHAKAMWGKVKAQTFKSKKGKGSYSRKGKHKGIYESIITESPASNFKSMDKSLPLLVWLDYDSVYDGWLETAREEVERELADRIEEMNSEEIEALLDERVQKISSEDTNSVTVLDASDYESLEFDKDEFNINFRNKFDGWDGDVVFIEYGYYDGAQLYVDPYGMNEEEFSEVEEFLYTMKEKYYLTELGGYNGLGYSNLGKGQGLEKTELSLTNKNDDDLKEDFLPPSDDLIQRFLKILDENGYRVDSIKKWGDMGEEDAVHIQITSKTNNFSESSFIEEVDKMGDIFDTFDKERKNHITYSFGLTSDNYITAGIDIRAEYLGEDELGFLKTENLKEEKEKFIDDNSSSLFKSFDVDSYIKAGQKEFLDKLNRKAKELGVDLELHQDIYPTQLDPFWYDGIIATIKYENILINIYTGGENYIRKSGESIVSSYEEIMKMGLYTDVELYELTNDPDIEIENSYFGFEIMYLDSKGKVIEKSAHDYYDMDYDSMYDIYEALDIEFYVKHVIPDFKENYGKLEEGKYLSGKPSKDDLKNAAKRHKKTDKKGSRGWFVRFAGPNAKYNIDRFNYNMSGGTTPQPEPQQVGDSGSSGGGIAPAGLGESVVNERFEKHEELNPKLWEDNNLKVEVREKINQIVDMFLESLVKDGIKINPKDIVLVGSNASYNYTDKSDLDVHIVADTSTLECPDNLYPLIYSAYRSIFNKKFEIDFYGVNVELYVETEDSTVTSNGVFSLNTGWIKEPVKEDIPEIDENRFEIELEKWEDLYFDIIKDDTKEISTEKPIEDVLEESLELDKVQKIDDYIEDLYDMRKVSIKKGGEYSIGNLVFKEIRNLGYLDVLKNLKTTLLSKEMSLEGLQESLKKGVPTLSELNEIAKGITENGTYFINKDGELEKINLMSGFQVSFFRPEITDSDIKKVIGVIGKTFGQQFIGIYGGSPEVSYTLDSSRAKEIARIFNQESIWDNEKGDDGFTENTHFDGKVKVDYDKAINELKELLGKSETTLKEENEKKYEGPVFIYWYEVDFYFQSNFFDEYGTFEEWFTEMGDDGELNDEVVEAIYTLYNMSEDERKKVYIEMANSLSNYDGIIDYEKVSDAMSEIASDFKEYVQKAGLDMRGLEKGEINVKVK